MSASNFRSQALANSHRMNLLDFSKSAPHDLESAIMRDLLESRRGMAHISPADQGFPIWQASVQGFLMEVGDVVKEVYKHWPEGYLLLLQEMTHGMRMALPQRLFGKALAW